MVLRQLRLSVLSGLLAVATAVSAVDPAAAASGVQKTLSEHGCTACHSIHGKLVGPPFDWVAYRYRNVARGQAVQTIARFIVAGGTGYWEPWVGGIPMPSHARMNRDEAGQIARWIMSLPPVKPPAKPAR